MEPNKIRHIALIGLGTIGMSMAAVHLRDPHCVLDFFDVRPDLEQQVLAQMPSFLKAVAPNLSIETLLSPGRINIHPTLESAVASATIIQEQGPENAAFKKSLWAQIERFAPRDAHFWSSTSGIPASVQSADMEDKSRLLVVHPFNPPHIMPLLEIVPGPRTKSEEVDFVMDYFHTVSPRHRPVLIKKEVSGFVGNRIAFAVLREASYLVDQGVISVQDLDKLMMASLGPRWSVNGVFESYNAGGGEGGFGGFLNKLEGTISDVWSELGTLDIKESDAAWRDKLVTEVEATYSRPTPEENSAKAAKLQELLQLQDNK